MGAGWASRVFYSDDGSTAVEVALKMAFRKYLLDNAARGLLLEEQEQEEGGGGGTTALEVLALSEAYHGDTLGAMDAVPPSPFNGRMQTPWYTGRGLFLVPPTAVLRAGAWRVQLPSGAAQVAGRGELRFASQAALFDVEGRVQQHQVEDEEGAPPGGMYRLYCQLIEDQLEQYRRQQEDQGWQQPQGGKQQQQRRRRRELGACILEPVLQGAGGMRLVDPLYQRALVDACRCVRLPACRLPLCMPCCTELS